MKMARVREFRSQLVILIGEVMGRQGGSEPTSLVLLGARGIT